jgi:aromatic ring-opening dioxygenase LigB subunit
MPVVGAFIMPHGALPLNPGKYPQYPELMTIFKSCYQVAESIYSLKPDLIYLSTPHGISLTRSYGVYMNNQASGTAEWEGEWKDYTVKVDLSEEDSTNILKMMKTSKFEAEGIVGYSETEFLPLRWGEVIPLWFMQQPYKNNTMNPEPFPKCVILSVPRKRLTEPECMVTECLDLGKELGKYFSNSNKRVVVVVSGDMAHTHITNKTNDFSNMSVDLSQDEADIFDQAIGTWAGDPINNEKTLIDSSRIVTKYLSCGYTGFVILQGLLKEISSRGSQIKGNVLCNCHPTYYGMMVAMFEINQ